MDIVCYSHLRWNFVYQRPQHLMSRLAKHFRIFFVEEPIFDTEIAYVEQSRTAEGVWVIVPHLPVNLSDPEKDDLIFFLLSDIFLQYNITVHIAWYYTPMSITVGKNFNSSLVIYDCMDELSAFKFAPPEMKHRENQLFASAEIVFTGGYSLHEAKKYLHDNILLFPSSIDTKHFESARTSQALPWDQETIPSPRIGFFGVIDERMDLDLVMEMAVKKPEWHFVFIGPVVKIDQNSLPQLPNVHFLGQRNYNDLPAYIAGWDVAMMPFAINESTRFISPTKTPEYLAAGKPVISTAIHDVVKFYGDTGLIYIANTADEFITNIESALRRDKEAWLKAVDIALANNSWDITCEKMMYQINIALWLKKTFTTPQQKDEYV
jgi:glycosyltransferase involved in cell wall biosynthesis